MSETLAFVESAAAFSPQNPLGAWDAISFLENAKTYLTNGGGALLFLLGVAIVVWAGVLIAKKFFGSGQNQQESWGKIVLMLIIGGALSTGGITLILKIAQGGEQTITDLGGGFIIQNASSFLSLLG